MISAIDRYFGIAGRTVLLTGAARGIGSAMAEAFADAGARLLFADCDGAALDALVAAYAGRGIEVHARPADLGDHAQRNALVDAALSHFEGRIDVLICNAGVSGPFGPMGDATEAERVALFAVNLHHPLHFTTRLAPHMAANGGGSIVLTASIAGLRGNANLGLYGITKAALMQLARNLAVEWGPAGVRANAIAPGLIRTGWADAILSSPEASAARLQSTPLRRIGEPWEIAAAALFLAGPGSAFITGQTLVVDGGTLISDGN